MNDRALMHGAGGARYANAFRAACWLTVMAIPLTARAAEPAVAPSAGTILQQAQPVKPAVPSSTGTGLTVEQPGGPALPPSAPFAIKTIVITGNSVYDAATLHALVADAEGRSLTLVELGGIVGRITDYYQKHGYPLARALIPAQSIRAGVVQVVVIEAHYGAVNLDNRSRAADGLLRQTLATLQPGQVVSQSTIDRALLLVSDIPGVAVTATLTPGDAVGTSNLQVQADPTAPVTGTATLDNDGDRYTGRARIGTNVNFIDPFRHGDTLSVGLLSSGSGMSYGSLAYESVLDGAGTRLGGSYSGLHYALGDTLSRLDAHGTAQVASLWVKQPLLRTVDDNVYGQLRYDRKWLDDDIDATQLRTDRHLDNWSASINGDWRDDALAGGAGTWNIGFTRGRVDFDNPAAELADSTTAMTQGSFSLWNGSIAHLLNLTQDYALYVSLSGQWTNKNVDASEKLVAGGPYSARAYDIDAISGDTGALGSVELRHGLGRALGGQWQVLGFIDSQYLTVNKDPWAPGANSATLNGGGVGLNWTGPRRWFANTYIAAPIGATPTLVGTNNSVRIWVELDKGF